MLHDPALLERLSGFETERFDGEDFRATRRSLDPLAASTSGGRWMPQGFAPVLYTSLLREGALAEISYHWGRLTPRPGKPAFLHRLGVSTERRLRLLRADLEKLDIDVAQVSHDQLSPHAGDRGRGELPRLRRADRSIRALVLR